MHESTKLLWALADRVTSAEKSVGETRRWVQSTAERVERDLATGHDLNALGELQGTGPGLDVAVSRLQEASEAFRIAWHYLADDAKGDPEIEWLTRVTDKSPRLSSILERATKD